MHAKWEYLVEGIPAPSGQAIGIVRTNASTYIDPIQTYLNSRGEDGWELIQVSSRSGITAGSVYTPDVVFVFKRPKL